MFPVKVQSSITTSYSEYIAPPLSAAPFMKVMFMKVTVLFPVMLKILAALLPLIVNPLPSIVMFLSITIPEVYAESFAEL